MKRSCILFLVIALAVTFSWAEETNDIQFIKPLVLNTPADGNFDITFDGVLKHYYTDKVLPKFTIAMESNKIHFTNLVGGLSITTIVNADVAVQLQIIPNATNKNRNFTVNWYRFEPENLYDNVVLPGTFCEGVLLTGVNWRPLEPVPVAIILKGEAFEPDNYKINMNNDILVGATVFDTNIGKYQIRVEGISYFDALGNPHYSYIRGFATDLKGMLGFDELFSSNMIVATNIWYKAWVSNKTDALKIDKTVLSGLTNGIKLEIVFSSSFVMSNQDKAASKRK